MILEFVNKDQLRQAQEELKKHVICSYQSVEELKRRYRKRYVRADRNCPDNEMFYWNKRGVMRTVYLKEGSVYKSEMAPCELLNGIMLPTGYLIRIR